MAVRKASGCSSEGMHLPKTLPGSEGVVFGTAAERAQFEEALRFLVDRRAGKKRQKRAGEPANAANGGHVRGNSPQGNLP